MVKKDVTEKEIPDQTEAVDWLSPDIFKTKDGTIVEILPNGTRRLKTGNGSKNESTK